MGRITDLRLYGDNVKIAGRAIKAKVTRLKLFFKTKSTTIMAPVNNPRHDEGSHDSHNS